MKIQELTVEDIENVSGGFLVAFVTVVSLVAAAQPIWEAANDAYDGYNDNRREF